MESSVTRPSGANNGDDDNDDDNNAEVTAPDLSNLDPIVDSSSGGTSSGKSKASGSGNTRAESESGNTSVSLSDTGLALIVLGVVAGVTMSLFFVHTRKSKQEAVRQRGSSQQRELDAFFEHNRTNLPLTQSQLHPRGYRAASSNGSQLLNSSDRMTPAEDIVVASFISRSTDPAQRSTRQQTQTQATASRFDDSVLRGTAAFRLTGQLPPSPASGGGSDDDRSDRGSDESTFDIGLSFVSNDSSAMYPPSAPSERSSSASTSSSAWRDAPSNVTSEQLSFGGDGSDVGDFRSTGGVPSMFSDADSLELRGTNARPDSAFNMFMKPSFDEVRLSSGVYSSGAVPRASGTSDVSRPSGHSDIVSASYDDGDSSGDEILDEANDFSIVDATAVNPLAMSRVSELSEGSL